jgi:hypothetical protein
VVLLAICEVLLRQQPNDYKIKRAYLDKNSNEVEVLFLGNSHAYFGANPEYMSLKSYNAAYASQSLDLDLEILKKYDGNWKNLKYIVLSMDYISLVMKLEVGPEEWRLKNYNIYWGIRARENFIDYSEVFNGTAARKIDRFKKYYLGLGTDVTSNDYGWGTSYRSAGQLDLEETGKTSAERHTVPDYRLWNENRATMRKLIEFSSRNNVQLVLLGYPGYKSYVSNLNQRQLYRTIDAATLLDRRWLNVHYYNFLTDPSFVAEDFYDGDHLNEKGAKKLTLKLDSVIKRQTALK